MDQQIASRLEADLFLLHAPSVYDGGRWFADVTVPQQMIEDILATPVGR